MSINKLIEKSIKNPKWSQDLLLFSNRENVTQLESPQNATTDNGYVYVASIDSEVKQSVSGKSYIKGKIEFEGASYDVVLFPVSTPSFPEKKYQGGVSIGKGDRLADATLIEKVNQKGLVYFGLRLAEVYQSPNKAATQPAEQVAESEFNDIPF